MSEKVSIIIPVFNREKVLQETLNSVVEQTHPNWECLLIDDGSTDTSVQMCINQCRLDERFHFFLRNDFNNTKGPSACRNIGIEKSKGTYVIFLDSDDLLDKVCLENRLKKVKEYPDFDAWVFQMQDFDENGLGKVCTIFPENDDYSNEHILKMILRYDLPFSVTCPLWRTKAIKELGGFDESFTRLEDPDLHARAMIKGLKFQYLFQEKPDCFYRVDSSYHSRFSHPEFLENYLFSFLKFYQKYLSISHQEKGKYPFIKQELKKSLLLQFKDHLYRKPLGLLYFSKVFKFSKKHHMLTFQERSILMIMKFYVQWGLDKVSGFGYHKMRKKVFV